MMFISENSQEHARSIGEEAFISGYVHAIRKLGGASFIVLRNQDGFTQVVCEKGTLVEGTLQVGAIVEANGLCKAEERAPGGTEIAANRLIVRESPLGGLPADLAKKELLLALDTDLELRPLSLRHTKYYHRFKIQAALASAFREYLNSRHFTEIFSPKLVSGNAEGGANVFHINYFGQQASLAQSPQLYKQIMVGVYGRVFETGHVYRAEPHNTSRHLNEYLSLDLEMGFIKSFHEIMAMEVGCLSHMMQKLSENCASSLAHFSVELPKLKEVPVLHLKEACELISKVSGEHFEETGSLSGKGEKMLSEAVKKQFGSDFVFVTHYSVEERPFYAKEDPERSGETLSFDLIFKGMEITTGGQRIHEYDALLERMKAWNLALEPFHHYLMAFKGSMPPHGGFGLGLERLTALLTGAENVKEASLFPRDMTRLTP